MDYFNLNERQKTTLQAQLFRRMRMEQARWFATEGQELPVSELYAMSIQKAEEAEEYELAQALKDSMEKYSVNW